MDKVVRILKGEYIMENLFEKAYQERTRIRIASDIATSQNNEPGIAKAQNALNEWRKQQNAKGEVFSELCHCYINSKINGNSILSVRGFASRNLDKYFVCMRENGITKFTFYSTSSNALIDITRIVNTGGKVVGTTKVLFGRAEHFYEEENVDALVIKIA